ncbi:MAG TPA: dihydrolipoamide acetyltransferase family protein [Thermomicrobiales bacterium]
MAIEIVMPRLGWNMEVGTVVEWLKQDGDRVNAGEYLFMVESDKSISEVEALDSGTLRIPGNALRMGEELPVGTVLAYLVQDDEAAPPTGGNDAPAPAASPAQTAPAPVAPVAAAPASAERATNAEQDRVRRRRSPVASPRAIRIATALGVDWTKLTGSSRSGRIVEQDIREAFARQGAAASGKPADAAPVAVASTAPPAPSPAAIPLSPMRRTIAERMARSAHTAAAVTLTTEADASALVRVRADLAAALLARGDTRPMYNDFFVRLVAVALRDFPELNASLTDEGIVRHEALHIGLAVDTERGLLVPVLRDVQDKSVQTIAGEAAVLIAAARAGKTPQADLQGGTFTITNLGMYEIDAFTPIINPPQCAILGIGRIVARPVVIDEETEAVAVRKMVVLSLTFDHRLVDGGPAARFLQRIKQYVEQPIVWLTA